MEGAITIAFVTNVAHRCESEVLKGVIDEIDAHLVTALRSRRLPEILEEAVCYAVLQGGKRLRPALVLLSCEAAGGRRVDALDPALALELIHAFSLVHDDLPAMDDDDLRRGRPTLHIHAGEAMAILAGDAMMSLAFEFISRGPQDGEVCARLTRELAAATTAMISGQVYDTLGSLPAELTDEQRLTLIHRSKTGALLRAACRIGGLCGGADQATLQHLTDYGEAIGLMFQIVDDLIDVTQPAEHVGKATGKDLTAGKLTYPGVLGEERSRADVQRLRDEAHLAISPLGEPARPLGRLCDDLAIRTK
jgi:geranylgeranyl pyrophosphate synthase